MKEIIKVFGFLLGTLLCGSLTLASSRAEIPQDLWQALSKVRHQIEVTDNGYHAFNPGNHQRYGFQSEGLVVEPTKQDADWRFGLRLSGFGTVNEIHTVKEANITVEGQRIEYQRGKLTEWYQNKSIGLEQGFTIHQPPQAGSDTLVIAMAIEGGLNPHWQEQGQSIAFHQPDGGYALSYNKLIVEDANQRRLPAHLELKGATLQIHVVTTNAVYPIVIDPLVVNEQKVTASDVQLGNFGISVSLSGDTALVGDTWNKIPGAAYVFTRSRMTWTKQAKLTASYGNFGYSVSLSGDGDTALVGANMDYNDNGDPVGSAYVFTRSGTTWNKQAKLMASDGYGFYNFGIKVSLSGDGDTALVGSYGRYFSGAAYVFTRSGTIWTEQAKLTASNGGPYLRFGSSVSLSGDGDTALVGADGDYNDNGYHSAGAAYVFTRSGTTWSKQAMLTASDGMEYDFFGRSVSLSGDTALVGAPWDDNENGRYANDAGAAYVFTRSGTTWIEQAKLTATNGIEDKWFGQSVSLWGDTALVGALSITDNAIDTGSAYVFTRSGTTWTKQDRLTASFRIHKDRFGLSVSLSGDTALVGAPEINIGNGSAYLYTLFLNNPASSNIQSDANKLFNWLEELFPEMLPPTHTQYAAGWCFRHYHFTAIYTGVVCEDGGQFPFEYVYALDAGEVYEFGHISQYSDQFNNQSDSENDEVK